MGDNAIENIDDLLKRATKEYKILSMYILQYLIPLYFHCSCLIISQTKEI